MKKQLIGALILTMLGLQSRAQDVEVINFEELNRLINERDDGIRIFNFWATWCKPCVVELPYFEKLAASHQGPLTIYLISLDFVEELDSKVKPFIRKKNLQSEVKLLDETDYNSFIDRVSKEWSGAIPATLFVDATNGRRSFYEGEIEEQELKDKFKEFVD